MGKKGKNQKKGPKNPKKLKLHDEDVDVNDMDDEIDAFHKNRDMIPLDVNADVDSDEDDDEHPVFDYQGINDDDDDDDDDDADEDEDEEDDRGLAAKIARQQKFLREKFGGVEDEMLDDAEEDEKKATVWSRGKRDYYGAENKDYELQSSDEETPAEEEEEVIKLQKERAESLRAEDFGLQSDEQDDSDEEPTLEEIMVKGKTTSKTSLNKEGEGDAVPMYEEVKKDLGALSRDEQMAIVDSSAPELVGLLAELNDAVNQLETQVNPLLKKVPKGVNAKNEGRHYLEVKQLLLLAYCQAITFYLLLKSEGQPVRDHPVIVRLVEMKSLLDKMKELDGNLPDGLEDVLNDNSDIASAPEIAAKNPALLSNLDTHLNDPYGQSVEKQEAPMFGETVEPVKKQSSKSVSKKRRRADCQDDSVNSVSVKMLQYRAALEEKLKQKGAAGSVHTKTDNSKKQKLKRLTGNLETIDDFDDDALDLDGTTRANGRQSTLSSKVSKFVTGQDNLRKGVSGDDDLPERDDLGERRWKHELRVLAGAGIKSMDDDVPENEPDSNDDDDDGAGGSSEIDGSEDEFYKQIKNQRAAKHAMKAQKYSRNQQLLHEPETSLDGKRQITTQIDKNRGLTRPRNKQYKNPRKKNRMKHAKAVSRRKGQVRDIKKPYGPYGGETTGINARISRSIRFKG